MTASSKRETDRHVDLAVLSLGVLALAVGTYAGWNERFLTLLVAPPGFVRAALVAAAGLLAFLLLGRAVERISTADEPRDTIRGVRFAFLALAAVAAAGGWLVASALPILVAAVIAGVDVIETTFLLVVTRRGRA